MKKKNSRKPSDGTIDNLKQGCFAGFIESSGLKLPGKQLK